MPIDRDKIDDAEAAQRHWLVPASVTLAQFGLESSWGKYLAAPFNPFGIKEFRDASRQRWVNTREVYKGKSVVVKQPFRIFASWEEAFDYHARLLATAPVYHAAMEAWTKPPYSLRVGVQLMAAHYATDPNYASAVMNIINSMKLEQYDREAGQAGPARLIGASASLCPPLSLGFENGLPSRTEVDRESRINVHPVVAALAPGHTMEMA